MPWQLVGQCDQREIRYGIAKHGSKYFSLENHELACYSQLLKAKWSFTDSIGLYFGLTEIETQKFDISEQIIFLSASCQFDRCKIHIESHQRPQPSHFVCTLTQNQALGRRTHTQSQCCTYSASVLLSIPIFNYMTAINTVGFKNIFAFMGYF